MKSRPRCNNRNTKLQNEANQPVTYLTPLEDRMKDKHTMGKKNRKRPYGETTKKQYASTCFEQRSSSGRPRSPHSFFETSHEISFKDIPTDSAYMKYAIKQVVHKHRNDLCIVTAGENIPSTLEATKVVAVEASACSAAQKRKRQAKMLKGQEVEDSVSPSTVLAELHLTSGEIIPLYACVFGTIIEVNENLTKENLTDDPLLNGFLAIILPSGSYPPKHISHDEHDDQGEAADNALTTGNVS